MSRSAGDLLPLFQGGFTFLKNFCSVTSGPNVSIIHISLPGVWRIKVFWHGIKSVDRDSGHARRQLFQMKSPLKPLGRLKPNCMWRLYGMGEYYFVHKVWVTWPRCPPCQFMVKMFSSSTKKQLTTWYVVSVTWGLPSLFEWWFNVDLWSFYRKVSLTPLCIYMGNIEKSIFQELLKADNIIFGTDTLLTKEHRKYMSINVKVNGWTFDFVSRSHDFTFSITSALKLLGELWPYFIFSFLGFEEWKLIQIVLVRWSRWPPCPNMV